jgi:murein DD-endopeptidase MepM/ murein hydrolase activator NlpD
VRSLPQRVHALCLLAGISLGAAACHTDSGPLRSTQHADIPLQPDSEILPGHVPPHATFATLLRSANLHDLDVGGAIEAVTRVFDLRRLRQGQAWRVERTLAGCIRRLEYEVDPEHYLHVESHAADPHRFDAEIGRYDVHTTSTLVKGGIDDDTPSLFEVMSKAGEQPDLPIALAEIFGGEIDFNSDLQPGDRFRLVVEKTSRDSRFVKYGPVQAASFTNAGRTLVAVRYVSPAGTAGYYDPSGRSLKRFFLRSPLRFDPQITSGFSRARLHPVLHEIRAHLGVDYRAAVGAPVVAVSNGIVTRAGWNGGAGRMVSIRHAGGYESSYLHLSAIAVRAGAHVAQGQLIGRVGQTGLATGPHLDYRLRKNGAWVNPVAEHRRMPPGEPIPGQLLPSYAIKRDARLAELGADPHEPAVAVAAAAH